MSSAVFQYEVSFTWYEGEKGSDGVVLRQLAPTAAVRYVDTIDEARRVARGGRASGIVPPQAAELEVTVQRLRRFPPGPWAASGNPEVVVLETTLEMSPFATRPEAVASVASTAWWLERIRGQLAEMNSPLFGNGKIDRVLRSPLPQEQTF